MYYNTMEYWYNERVKEWKECQPVCSHSPYSSASSVYSLGLVRAHSAAKGTVLGYWNVCNRGQGSSKDFAACLFL